MTDNSFATTSLDDTLQALPARPRNRSFRLAVRLASLLRAGTLDLTLPDGTTHRFGGAHPGPAAKVTLIRPRAVRRFATGGSLGWAEAYIDGDWTSPDIRAVMAVAAANEAEWQAVLLGRPVMRAISRLLHALRPNTKRGSKRNIAAHYDLGNDFYAAWLDPTMTYSSALFEDTASLEQAQERKVRRLLDAIDLRPGHRLLEIGCGWGYLAEIAARDYGAHVVALTLSREQHAYAVERLARAGLSEQVEVRLQDWRDTVGTFDRVASIEMFEAVGEARWPHFFASLRDRLAPGGLAALQIITIADRLFDDYRAYPDFIQRYVFPGGMLPPPTRLREEVARAGLSWRDAHWFGHSYAETLRHWNDAFQAKWPTLSGPLRDDRFKRLWEYYLAYCETGFRAGWTDVGQIVLARG